MMDRDKDAQLTFDEFVEGSKQDPTIVQVRSLSPTIPSLRLSLAHHLPFVHRPCRYTMD